MKFIVCENYDEMSARAAEIFIKEITEKPDCVLGLATGSTPIGMYEKLAAANLDFSRVTTVNLDEYYPILPENENSYRYFMNKNLFDKVNIDKNNTHVPSGTAKDAEEECRNYDKIIEKLGGIDLQVLGIGQNGHIGFNEPSDVLVAGTHVTELSESTIEANSRFFVSESDVPRQALTMGMASIFSARKIVLLASGKNKHEAISALMSDKITTRIPATMLKMHPDVTVICDGEAYYG
ncbi:MAG: glucosamine-6-phosphate deaminase [Clostridia bacterium]|nr:glucosamine-6-phosphate deaminase [Clostridia bacterium]